MGQNKHLWTLRIKLSQSSRTTPVTEKIKFKKLHRRKLESYPPNKVRQGTRKGWYPCWAVQSRRSQHPWGFSWYPEEHLGRGEDAWWLPWCLDSFSLQNLQNQGKQTRMWKLQKSLTPLHCLADFCSSQQIRRCSRTETSRGTMWLQAWPTHGGYDFCHETATRKVHWVKRATLLCLRRLDESVRHHQQERLYGQFSSELVAHQNVWDPSLFHDGMTRQVLTGGDATDRAFWNL